MNAPIVLVHGILGFADLRLGPWPMLEYFRGIRAALLADGHRVPMPPTLSPAGPSATRAQALRVALDAEPMTRDGPFHLIAHSMGGLDCRQLLAQPGMAGRVLSLTTIGTPHRGSPFADRGVAVAGRLVRPLVRLGLDLRGFLDLTTAVAEQFNQAHPDLPGIRYRSVAGDYRPGSLDLLRVPAAINQSAGPNDGLVPVSSAQWGESLEIWPGNHLRLINWCTNGLAPPDQLWDQAVIDRYRSLVAGICAGATG